jgi:hypothetical protein
MYFTEKVQHVYRHTVNPTVYLTLYRHTPYHTVNLTFTSGFHAIPGGVHPARAAFVAIDPVSSLTGVGRSVPSVCTIPRH